jgi:hypothetical protein
MLRNVTSWLREEWNWLLEEGRRGVEVAKEPLPPVSESAKAKAFLEFEYAEIKDLSKQFLTVVAGVLALSVTFSEKIVNFTQAGFKTRLLMMSCWVLCLGAFLLGGCAIFLIYNAGGAAKRTILYQRFHPYRLMAALSYWCLDVAGAAFVLALVLLVLAAFLRLK